MILVVKRRGGTEQFISNFLDYFQSYTCLHNV